MLGVPAEQRLACVPWDAPTQQEQHPAAAGAGEQAGSGWTAWPVVGTRLTHWPAGLLAAPLHLAQPLPSHL